MIFNGGTTRQKEILKIYGSFVIVTISEGEQLTFSRQELETPRGAAKEEKVYRAVCKEQVDFSPVSFSHIFSKIKPKCLLHNNVGYKEEICFL